MECSCSPTAPAAAAAQRLRDTVAGISGAHALRQRVDQEPAGAGGGGEEVKGERWGEGG